MGKLQIAHYMVGPVQTNCYFAINKETREVLVIDPGEEAARLMQQIKAQELTVVAILLTHGHFDHAGGAGELSELCNAPVYAHEAEKETLESDKLNASWMVGKKETYRADLFVKDEQELDLAGFHIRVLFTPGHTKGGCCYYFPYEDVVFSGDTLFQMSVGRTDFEGGSMSQIVRSIQEKLMPLPDKTVVYPGHGDVTTIETERMYNPYL
ncbi:MAG: MBL fold metallo-hydrolase [Agathobacter sp.]|nr:MBL fold metallo-hydrolase [Agathobacter sp.]